MLILLWGFREVQFLAVALIYRAQVLSMILGVFGINPKR